jgi:hypothetical protein
MEAVIKARITAPLESGPEIVKGKELLKATIKAVKMALIKAQLRPRGR